MSIKWNASFSVGYPFLDSQHEELFALANLAFDAKTKVELVSCLMSLFKYVRRYFQDEEQFMKQECYDLYTEHSLLHMVMVERLGAIALNIGKGNLEVKELHKFMSEWLLNHILVEDKKLADFIKG